MPTHKLIVRGGIGSGKSSVAELLAAHGATVISADTVGHTVLEPGGEAYDGVRARWPEVVGPDGIVDRSRLAEIVFADPDELRELEAMTHPAIRKAIAERVEATDGPVVVELPLPSDFLEGEWVSIVVDAPDDLRRSRLVARGMSDADITARMASQPTRLEWLGLADIVVDNSGDLDALSQQVDELWESLASP